MTTAAGRSAERFLVTGALGCIGAWTVRQLVREGVPVVAFDLGTDPRRLALIMSPEELARGHVRRRRHHRPRVRSSEPSRRTLSRTSSTSPRCRCRSAGRIRRAAPRSMSTGTVNVFEAVSAGSA